MRSWSFALGLLAVCSAPALAHENGAIYLASKQVSVGAELSLRGDKLAKNATLRLQLRGVLETFPLAEVRTDSAGRFQARFGLPAEAKAGTYTVVVLASDGDVVARAEIGIVAAAGEMTAEEHAKMGQPGAETEGPHPTAEHMDVPVATTWAGWAAIAGLIAASAGLGLALLLRGAPGRAT